MAEDELPSAPPPRRLGSGRTMTSADVVAAFIPRLEMCLLELRAHLRSVGRDSPRTPMVATDTSGRRSRSGRFADWGYFQLHGVGCRVELDSGGEVDFDWFGMVKPPSTDGAFERSHGRSERCR